MSHLNDDTARRVFDILVDQAGARESLWEQFAIYLTGEEEHGHEFRFQGALGRGGKLIFQRRTFGANLYVTYEPDDETPEREEIVKITNRALSGIDYLLKVTEERELTPEDEETIRYLLEGRYEEDDA
jgi:hypothetical protein